MRGRIAALAFISITLAGAFRAAPHERTRAKHTYNHHVRPILVKHCAQCHDGSGIAPMSLMKYLDASPWAAAIRAEVLDRKMPPWQPEEGIGDFQGSHYLNVKEIEAIVDWATGGTPEGDPIKLDDVEATTPSWTLGAPGHVLQAPAAVLSPEVAELTKCTLIAAEQRNLVIRAIDFQPGNREIVHSLELTTSPECDEKAMPLATWLPGSRPVSSPNGYAWTIPWGKQLFLRVLYRKTWRHDGKEMRDQTRVGLYFADPLANAIQSKRVDDAYVAEEDLRLIAIYADGAQRVEVDGKPILQIDNFDSAWNGKLVLKEPVVVRKGSRITGKAWLEFVD